MKKNLKFLVAISIISISTNASMFEPIPLTEYSCDFGGNTVKWYDVSTWLDLRAINNTLAKEGCKYARRKIRESYVDDVEKLSPYYSPDINNVVTGQIVGCPSRDNVPMTINGAHPPTKYNFGVPTYTISRNTPYELYQKDQSNRGTNRLDKWYSQWHIKSGFEGHAEIYKHVENMFINGRKNGHNIAGPMKFSNYGFLNLNIDSTKKYQVISNMTRGSREYSFGIGGSFDGGFGGFDFNLSLPSAKINGERCYSTTVYNLEVKHNTKPVIRSILKESSNLIASASDEHTAEEYLSYTWEITDKNNGKHYRTGKKISLNGIQGNYYRVILNVSDGDKSSAFQQTFEETAPVGPIRPIDVRPCPTCALP